MTGQQAGPTAPHENARPEPQLISSSWSVIQHPPEPTLRARARSALVQRRRQIISAASILRAGDSVRARVANYREGDRVIEFTK